MEKPEEHPSAELRPALPNLHANASDLKIQGMSEDVRPWTSDKRKGSSSYLKYENWNTRNLSSRIAVDATAAGAAGILVAPVITVIDQAIIENASNRATIFESAANSFKTMLLRPHHFLASRPFRLIFMLYTGTYMSANSLDTVTSTTRRPPPSLEQEHYSAAHVTSGSSKFATTSATNLSLCVYKDNQFTKLFGASSSRPVPRMTLALYGLRDMLTVFASFNVPPLLAPQIPLSESMQKYVSQASAAQFIAPAAVQIFSTPLHLLGLDLYNRPGVSAADRMSRVVRDWGKSCAARICRIVPAFGVGGVVNNGVRRTMMESLD